jgi:hypothetical protein
MAVEEGLIAYGPSLRSIYRPLVHGRGQDIERFRLCILRRLYGGADLIGRGDPVDGQLGFMPHG